MVNLDNAYRAEGWGKITDLALGIRPSDVESQAREVARYAADSIAVLEAQLVEARRTIFATHKNAVKHEKCTKTPCMICDGGLFQCADCGAAEAEAEERACTGPEPTAPEAQQEPVITAMFEVTENGIIGSTSAPVKRVEAQDDGSYTVVIDYWPSKQSAPEAQQEPVAWREIDLAKTVKHDHPDIVPYERLYLVKIDRGWFFGRFTRQWYGLSFSNWGNAGRQLDAPGYNSSTWEKIIEINPDALTIPSEQSAPEAQQEPVADCHEEAHDHPSHDWRPACLKCGVYFQVAISTPAVHRKEGSDG